MACSTGRCALRRFEGHGTSNYRPTNPEASKQQGAALERLIAERNRQDAGLFTVSSASSGTVPKTVTTNTVTTVTTNTVATVATVAVPTSAPSLDKFYSLSDAT